MNAERKNWIPRYEDSDSVRRLVRANDQFRENLQMHSPPFRFKLDPEFVRDIVRNRIDSCVFAKIVHFVKNYSYPLSDDTQHDYGVVTIKDNLLGDRTLVIEWVITEKLSRKFLEITGTVS